MSTRRKWLLALAMTLLVGVVVASFSRSKESSIVLPDGSKVSILKVSYGQTTHRFFHGGVVDKVLYGWVPNEWLDMCRLGFPGTAPPSVRRNIAMRAMKHITATYTTTNTLVVWFNQSSANIALPNLRVLPVDADGNVCTAPLTMSDSRSQNPLPSGPASERRFYFSYPAFPRRERDVRLRVFAQHEKNWEPAGEFKVPNPAYRNYPRWEAVPSPVTVSRDGYDFMLTYLVSGVDALHPPRPITTGEIGSMMFGFDFERGGKSSRAWIIDDLEVEDATGNLWNPGAHSRSGEYVIFGAGRSSTNEPLKVRATFSRRTDFGTNMLWRVQNVPLPLAGSFLLFTNLYTNFNGTMISLVAISDGGVQVPNSGISSSAPLIHFQVTPPAEQKNWRAGIVGVTDEQGKPVSFQSDARALFSRHIAYQFRYRPGTTNVNLTLSLHKSVTLEFITKATAP